MKGVKLGHAPRQGIGLPGFVTPIFVWMCSVPLHQDTHIAASAGDGLISRPRAPGRGPGGRLVEPCACFGGQSAPPRAGELEHVPALLGTMCPTCMPDSWGMM